MKNLFYTFACTLLILFTISSQAQIVSTFAGSGAIGDADGIGTVASFHYPMAVAVDANGNVYVVDNDNNKIRKINPAGVVTTLAGSGSMGSEDDTGMAASFDHPMGIAVDASGNVYVADTYNHKIRKINPAGVVTTFAGNGSLSNEDGMGTAASFNYPIGLAIDGSGNLYVADSGNYNIRKISPAGEVTTLAGNGLPNNEDGMGTAASFSFPYGIAVDGSGYVYVSDRDNNTIRKISPAGEVTTFAGSGEWGSDDGIGTAASFYTPTGITVDHSGNVYVTHYGNQKVRKISPAGEVSSYVGSGLIGAADGTAAEASFYYVYGLAVDGSGNLYLADTYNHKIRKVTVGTLPVVLVGFTAKAVGNYGQLQWQTANEHNNKGFEIWRKGERLEGGGMEGTAFVKIGDVSATMRTDGQLSVSTYTFTDKKPLNGNNYYKLVQLDNDGTVTELGIKTITFRLPPSTLNLYPNPFQTHLTIASPVSQSAEITNISGQLVKRLELSIGNNIVNTSDWLIGIYILKIPAESIKLFKK